jgi:teichuronic acid biosynthesis glycosyltransferase TuaH
VAESWRQRGFHPELIPFGVDANAFYDTDRYSIPPDVALPSPIIGFVGHINQRIDLRLLEAVAATGRSLLLVGPRTDDSADRERWQELLARPNVRWVGPKSFVDLPGYYAAIDVGLVPYGDSAFNRGSFPLKTLEYLAAGRPVVATGLPAVRWLATDLITIADDAATFAAAADRLAQEPRTVSSISARRQLANQHDWRQRAHAFISAIERAGNGRGQLTER